MPWPVIALPHQGELERLLDADAGELAWFADTRGWERQVNEPLRHYRWIVAPKRDSVRLLAAPKPRLKEIQRRLLPNGRWMSTPATRKSGSGWCSEPASELFEKAHEVG